MDGIVEKVAKAVLQSLSEDPDGYGYVGRNEELCETVLDGTFDLEKVACAAIRATLEHYAGNVSEGMRKAVLEKLLLNGYNSLYAQEHADSALKAVLIQALAELDA